MLSVWTKNTLNAEI